MSNAARTQTNEESLLDRFLEAVDVANSALTHLQSVYNEVTTLLPEIEASEVYAAAVKAACADDEATPLREAIIAFGISITP